MLIPKLEEFDESNQLIVEALRSSSSELRAEVLDGLGGLIDDELGLEIVRMIRSAGDENYRQSLVVALIPALLDSHSSESEMAPSEAALGSSNVAEDSLLSAFGQQAVLGGLASAFRDASVGSSVRQKILEVSVVIPQPWHEGAIRSAWASESVDWKLTAIHCMGNLTALDLKDEILEGLRAAEPAIRREALLAGSNRGMPEVLPEALRIATNEEATVEVRETAIEALGIFRSPDSVDALERIRQNEVDSLSRAAEVALQEIQQAGHSSEIDDLADVSTHEELMRRLGRSSDHPDA